MDIFQLKYQTKYNVLSLGAGVQSSCLALMAAHGDITPTPDFAVFADTGAEPENVYKWLENLKELVAKSKHPYPIYTVKSSRGDLTEEVLKIRVSHGKGKKPKGETYLKKIIPAFGIQDVEIMERVDRDEFSLVSDEIEGFHYDLIPTGKFRKEKTAAIGRACTEDYKILPVRSKIRELCEIKRGQKDVTVTMWIGISRDEMNRAKDSRVDYCQHRFPMLEKAHEMRRQDCIDWMIDNGYPEPPRSACYYCPFHDNNEWKRMRDEDPDNFQKAINFDKELRLKTKKHDKFTKMEVFLHSSCKPLDEVDFEDSQNQDAWSFQAECEGMCGV